MFVFLTYSKVHYKKKQNNFLDYSSFSLVDADTQVSTNANEQSNIPKSPVHDDNNNNTTITTTTPSTTTDANSENQSTIISSLPESQSEITLTSQTNPIQPQRKRRKNIPSSKISRPPATPSTSPTILGNNIKLEKDIPSTTKVPTNTSTTSNSSTPTSPSTLTTTTTTTKANTTMLFDLIRSLLEEKKLDHNDENLISTIDCLIDSLQHLRERITAMDPQTNDKHSNSMRINHDETYPLNLSKPKKRQQTRLASTNSDDMSPSATTVSSPSPTIPLPSTFFPSKTHFYEKPFFPQFAGLFSFLSIFSFKILLFSFSSESNTITKLSQTLSCIYG